MAWGLRGLNAGNPRWADVGLTSKMTCSRARVSHHDLSCASGCGCWVVHKRQATSDRDMLCRVLALMAVAAVHVRLYRQQQLAAHATAALHLAHCSSMPPTHPTGWTRCRTVSCQTRSCPPPSSLEQAPSAGWVDRALAVVLPAGCPFRQAAACACMHMAGATHGPSAMAACCCKEASMALGCHYIAAPPTHSPAMLCTVLRCVLRLQGNYKSYLFQTPPPTGPIMFTPQVISRAVMTQITAGNEFTW